MPKKLTKINWVVHIYMRISRKFIWQANVQEKCGIAGLTSEHDYQTWDGAKNAWMRFAERNGFINYKVVRQNEEEQ